MKPHLEPTAHGVRNVPKSGSDGDVRSELEWLHKRIEELGAAVAGESLVGGAAARSQEMVQLAAEAARLVLYDQTAEGCFRMILGLGETFGYDPGEVPFTREWWWSQVHPEDRSGAAQQLGKELPGAGECRLRYRMRRKDGVYITVEEWVRERRTPSGASDIVGCVKEVTSGGVMGDRVEGVERKDLQRDDSEPSSAVGGLQAEVQRLERLNRDLQEFASIASRDLRDPLRKILVFGEMVATRCCESEETREYLARMQSAAERMQSLLDSLMVYTGAVSGDFPMTEVDLGEAVREAVSNLQPRIRACGAEVWVEPLPVVEGDSVQMVHLFQNLIGNGLTFVPPGRPPLVRVFAPPVGPFHDPGSCEIRVEDNGIGFEERHLDRIFSPFQRLHGRDEYPGIGMGLAVCKKIIERHGGRIAAVSTYGKGSTFIVNLPKKKGSP